MAGSPSPVGHNGAGTFHDRLPVGIGHVCDQHITWLHLVHLRNAVYQAHRTSANFLTNGTALSQHNALAFELVTQLGCTLGLTFHCFRARLQNVDQAVSAVLAPLNVHGAAVMLFNDHGILRQEGDVDIGKRVSIAQLHGHIDGFNQLA